MIQDFISNSTIKNLAIKPFWTVNIDEKKPLDIVGYDTLGKIRGAKDDTCLTTLSELLRIVNAIPEQFVYNLNAVRDKVVVLDIEKTCPDNIKQTLLQLPFIYGDVSMSGQGFHLMFPCPMLDEITINKTVMKEEHKYYEILIHHYVTFTNNTIFPQYTVETTPIQFQEIWDKLRQTQKNIVKKDFEFDLNFEKLSLDFPYYHAMKDAIIRNFKSRFRKTPADFGNDMSRYEFAIIGSIRYSLMTIMEIPMFKHRIVLDEMQQIAVVYDVAVEIIPHRSKHDEQRDGKPMLLYQVINSFATVKN